MTNQKEVYKCEICGNIVEVLHSGAGTLVCCGKPMTLLVENTNDGAVEKHVPIIKKTESGVSVSVGEIPHPMDSEHYIEWVEVVSGNKTYKKYLNPGDSTIVDFNLKDVDFARAYCNLHGLWKSK